MADEYAQAGSGDEALDSRRVAAILDAVDAGDAVRAACGAVGHPDRPDGSELLQELDERFGLLPRK